MFSEFFTSRPPAFDRDDVTAGSFGRAAVPHAGVDLLELAEDMEAAAIEAGDCAEYGAGRAFAVQRAIQASKLYTVADSHLRLWRDHTGVGADCAQ